MPKVSKSSASSGTRKKHARRAAGPPQEVSQSLQKATSKPSKKEIKKGLAPPPKKSYIAPSKLKPAPIDVDPLDSLGLVTVLPPDLVVVLRRLAKKDGVTKTRALEELAALVDKARGENKREEDLKSVDISVDLLVTVLPVWLHRYPALSVHPSRRIRHLSASLHASLLSVSAFRDVILTFLLETGSETHVSHVLGVWCLSAWDIDRGVATVASKSWREAFDIRLSGNESTEDYDKSRFILNESSLARTLLPFVLTTIMDPESTYACLNPSHSAPAGEPLSSHASLPHRGLPSHEMIPPSSGRGNSPSTKSLSAMPPRGEDDIESAEDRNARLRVGAMGLLKWIFDTFTPTTSLNDALCWLLSSPLFWSVLHHAAQPQFLQAFNRRSGPVGVIDPHVSDSFRGLGFRQTIVRRAGWGIVHSLVGASKKESIGSNWIDNLSEATTALLSSAILRSAFVEPDPIVRSKMWEPLLVFLANYHNAWILDLYFEHAKGGKANTDDSSSELCTNNMRSGSPSDGPTSEVTSPPSSVAYAEFLAFLSLGCNGSPIQGYPTVLVILSTIPKEILPPILPPLSEFFDSLWAAVDGNVLSTLSADTVKSIDAFLGTWGECLLWTARKLTKSVPTVPERDLTVQDVELNSGNSVHTSGRDSQNFVSHALIELEFGRLVGQLGKDLRVSTSVTGRRVADVLEKLELVALDLSDLAWTHITRFVRDTITTSEDPVRGEYALEFLATLYEHLPPNCFSKITIERLVIDIATKFTSAWLGQSPQNKELALLDMTLTAKMLEGLMATFGPMLDRDEEFVKSIDELLQTNLTSLFSCSSLILSYLTLRSDITHAVTTWRLVLSALGSSTELDLNTRVRALGEFLDSVPSDGSPSWAKPRGGELDRLVGDALSKALDGDIAMQDLIKKLLKRPDAFLDTMVTQKILSTIVNTVETQAQYLIQSNSPPIKVLCSSLGLLLVVEREAPTLAYHSSVPLLEVMPSVFLLAFVMPQCSIEEEEYALELSRQVWDTWQQAADEKARQTVSEKVKNSLKCLIMNAEARPSPGALLHVFTHINTHVEYIALSDIIPSHSELDALLSSMYASPIDKTLSIIDVLVPTSSNSRAFSGLPRNHNFDSSGFSPYARGVSFLLQAMTSDRQFARKNLWALYHVFALAQFINEVLQVPEADSPVLQLDLKEARDTAKNILRQTQQIAAFLLISPGDENWHKVVVGVLSGQVLQSENLDYTGIFVKLAFEASLARGTVRDSLVLHRVLQYVLRNATKDDADQWIELARSLDEKALQTSLAISLAVTEFAPDSQRLDRYRNELASKLSGIPSIQVNGTGLRSLRRLVAVAPNPESDVIFLPQQRAVYLVQAFQTWMSSDEDLSESVENEITLILYYLAPILQNIQGSHWEFMVDMLESNIENSSFKDVHSLVLLSRSLHLSTCIKDLSVSNKYLRQLWGERSKSILVMVRDLLAAETGIKRPSEPRGFCREQALSIILDLPCSLMDENSLSVMCHLLTDPSVNIQKMAYQLLRQAAMKRTEFLNVEAGVNSEATVIQLPTELLALLQNHIDAEPGGMDASCQDPLASLLCWMTLFDLFDDASLKVKAAYVEQMRNLDIIGDYFVPFVFEILGLEDGSQKLFKLDAWSVNEFWTVFYDADVPQSLRLLAAHVYYRALLTVPSLIRTWWDGLKNRQLLTAVTSFTASHFSPVLIASELTLVKTSLSAQVSGEESLTDESFNVKVSHAVHEVTAIFNVDDQQVEIGVRLPVEYPLRVVEVRDIHRVGVPEKLWRKWLFAVQQVVTSQNGHIVDALSLFRKNVSLHFEGQVECAICYSIISVVDRSLPAKPCKTCKNRFHSSCLYKWFNTSHTSSCPLCRSDIM